MVNGPFLCKSLNYARNLHETFRNVDIGKDDQNKASLGFIMCFKKNPFDQSTLTKSYNDIGKNSLMSPSFHKH